MESVREHIYLAALLHDIGKFYQRADVGSVAGSKYLKEHCKDKTTFCPLGINGRYSHKHVLWTAQFIEDFASVFKVLVNDKMNDLSAKDNLMNLAAGHHLKNDQLSIWGRLIKEADCLSSGMDRSSLEALQDEQDEQESGWDAFKRKRMVSILQTIGLNMKDKRMKHLPVRKLELNKSFFPKDTYTQAPDYEGLWKDFINEFKYIQANTYRAFSETLLNLLYKYTSTVPASTVNFPDVSLYDHLKTTAALAVCLYDYQQANENQQEPFLLIGADFSGIQSYIYQIVSKHASKNLKGRSFYLRILSDAVVRFLLKELRLFQANIIYNSGGGFYLLAPNTAFVRETLQAVVQKIEKQFFKTHGTSIFVAIDSIPLSVDALMHRNGENLGKVWGDLFVKRDKRKSTKFANLMKEDYKAFFMPMLMGGDVKRDSVTGEEFLPREKYKEKGGLILKDITARQIEVGKKLRETNLLVIKEGAPLTYWKDRIHIDPIGLGFTYYFFNDEDELREMKDKLSASADEVSVITMNGKEGNCDFLHTLDGINNIYSLEFYGGNEIDRKNVPTFEEMCENKNLSRLGVLRMDVDNLGLIFQQGIPTECATLSRYAALSRSFDYFFSGYLNTIWREVAPERSFIIYSGGDDVFIVGSWEITIQLAERIKNDFAEFTCNNPAFSLSGGIAILSPKYPIMKGAEESANEESAAKNHHCQSATKNSISFMGMPLNWDDEFPIVKKLKSELVRLLNLNNNQLPKSFLSKLLMHHANAGIVNHKITKPKTYWMLTYDLSRMKSRYNPEVSSLLDNCIKEICNPCGKLNGMDIRTDYHALELWAFAARWAELEYRMDKK